MTPGKVSVIVLSHRARTHPAMVRACLDSVLAQTYADVQLVLQFDADLWPEKLNRAVAAAEGEFVAILCDDDLLDPRFVAQCMKAAPLADIVYTDRLVFQDGADPQTGIDFRMHGPAQPRDQCYRVRLTPDTFTFGVSLPMTILIRKTLWDELGGYDDMPHADGEFWFRAMLANARMVYVPQALFWYREHAGQFSRQQPAMEAALVAFHTKHFQQFGLAVPEAVLADGKITAPIIPRAERRSYAERFGLPTTRMPNMAQEFHALPEIARAALTLAQEAYRQQMQTLARQALASAGLSPDDGWTIDATELHAVRPTPDTPSKPVLVTDAAPYSEVVNG